MQLLDLQQRREEQELAQMQEDIGRSNNNTNSTAGHQSEPTTPPEYRETTSGFPSVFSRPNRYSTSSLTSTPGLYNRSSRSGSQLTSPQAGIHQSRVMDDKLASPNTVHAHSAWGAPRGGHRVRIFPKKRYEESRDDADECC